MAHEFTHTRQQVEAASPLVFFSRYSKHSAPWEFKNAYYSNPYEVKANYYEYANTYGKYYNSNVDLYGKGSVGQSLVDAFIRDYNRAHPGVQLPPTWRP